MTEERVGPEADPLNVSEGWEADLSPLRDAHRIGQKSDLGLCPAVAPLSGDERPTAARSIRAIQPIRPATTVVCSSRTKARLEDVLGVSSNRASLGVDFPPYKAVAFEHVDRVLQAQPYQ